MTDIISNSAFFGVFLSLFFYETGAWLKKKKKSALINPMLISIVLTIVTLLVFKIPYSTYNASAKYLTYFVTPATVCLAIPLYEQFELIKHNTKAILAGIISGIITTCVTVLAFALIFSLTHEEYVTLLPKSVTAPIGIVISEKLGGYPSVSAVIIILTGIIGNILAEPICKLFKITEPIAKGIGIGSSSHVIGTVKAMEMGKTEGAMSSLSIAVSGILTVLIVIVFSYIY